MKFVDVLRRYHISPLKYDDDVLLQEKDYMCLLKMLVKYAEMKKQFGPGINYEVDPRLFRKVEALKKNALFEPEEADVMDCLMEQTDSSVVKDEENSDKEI